MFGLLYSLKTKIFAIPFTFDTTNKGFDKGSWIALSIDKKPNSQSISIEPQSSLQSLKSGVWDVKSNTSTKQSVPSIISLSN